MHKLDQMLEPITTNNQQRRATADQYDGWRNQATQRIANEVFSSRQTFISVREVISDGKTLHERSELLRELMTDWLKEDWDEDEYFAEDRLLAWNKVNWKALAHEVIEYHWFA